MCSARSSRFASELVRAFGTLAIASLLIAAPRLSAQPAAEPTAETAPEPYPESIALPAEPAPEVPAQAAEAERVVIEDIIVTATKREASVRDLPISIDAFSGDQLTEIGANNLEALTRFSPGVTVSPGIDSEAATLIIRGVATDTFVNFFTRTFGLFYEDMPLVNPSILGPQPNLDPFDMATVEILKGPQGTLFGGSALAGAVRYVAKRPDLDDAYGQATANVGTLEKSDGLSHYYAAMWNQPLIADSLGLRVVASRRDTPGYLRDVRADQDDINSSESEQVRALLTWRASDDVDLDLHWVHRLTDSDNGSFANNTRTPEHDQRYYPDVTDARTTALMAKLRWGFEPLDVYLIGSRLTKTYGQDIDFSQFIGTSQAGTGLLGKLPTKSTQPSVELRLVSTAPIESNWWALRDWNYVTGYFYIHSEQDILLDLIPENSDTTVRLIGDVPAEEHALFFDVTRTFADHWEFGVGGRYFRQSTDGVVDAMLFTGSQPALTDPVLQLLGPNAPVAVPNSEIPFGHQEGKVSETVFNPKYTLTYRHSKDFAVFTSAIKGFRYAGVNQNPSQDPNVPLFFESDSIWNYELGLRSSWFDDLLQFDLTGYYLTWKDLQVQQRDFSGGFAYTANVGGARNIGVETSLKTVLPGGFLLNLTAGYVDAQTTTFFDDFQGPAEKGSELPGSAPFTSSVLLLYGHGFSSTDLTASVSYTYQNRNHNNLPHTYTHPALGLLNASAGLRLNRVPGKPLIHFVGSNLTNEFKPGVVFDTPNTGGVLVIFNQPRTLSMNISFDFGRD